MSGFEPLLASLVGVLQSSGFLPLVVATVVGAFLARLVSQAFGRYHRWRNERRSRGILERIATANRVEPGAERGPDVASQSDLISERKAPPAFYLDAIELRDIRCFRSIRIEFRRDSSFQLRTAILGDNALGKSTLLRAIAIALCNDGDAIALMKTTPGSMIRSGASEGRIVADLFDDSEGRNLRVIKIISLGPDGSETIRQEVWPTNPPDSIWDSVFVCGYGTQRTVAASASTDAYSARLAVATLFDSRAVLQNPEVVLLRQEPGVRRALQDRLLQVMLLDGTSSLESTPSGLHLRAPFGDVPIGALSDGYRSTAQWLLDLFSWLIYARRLPADREPAGILLIDEIEQHLHPRWQRHVIQRLSEQLPRMQIIATTHTPLVASGLADVEFSGLLRFFRGENQEPMVDLIDPAALRGKRADQVLTEFFDLATSRSPGSNRDLDRYVHLRSMPERTPPEQREFEKLTEQVEPGLQFGDSDFERKVDTAVSAALTDLLKQPPSVEFDVEAKRQLRELFGSHDDKN